jgi:cytochrome bd-type quinol oxidase subunit 2
MPVVTEHPAETGASRRRGTGVGRVLVAVYAILALAALGRSIFQIVDRFDEAPAAFLLSLLSGVVYVVATIALAARWRRIAWATIGFELLGVLVVGTITVLAPDLLGAHTNDPFGRTATVWSAYGAGYLLIPLALPVLGLLWLRRSAAARD